MRVIIFLWALFAPIICMAEQAITPYPIYEKCESEAYEYLDMAGVEYTKSMVFGSKNPLNPSSIALIRFNGDRRERGILGWLDINCRVQLRMIVDRVSFDSAPQSERNFYFENAAAVRVGDSNKYEIFTFGMPDGDWF